MKIFRCLFTFVQICVFSIILSGAGGDSGCGSGGFTTSAPAGASFTGLDLGAGGNLAANGSIVVKFDSDPGIVTTNYGTVSGYGKTRTIEGPFEIGELILVIEWTNGNGKREVQYTVDAADEAEQ